MNTQDEAVSSAASRLEFARQVYREFFTTCFWHLRPELEIPETMIPIIVKGLRWHGGRKGMLLAEKLERWQTESC